MKKILVINGSPKKDGNTAALAEWFREGAHAQGAAVEVVHAAFLKTKYAGCNACRKCQEAKPYGCVIEDEVSSVLLKMLEADAIVMASPLYFFSVSAQLKILMDRMFSLYKWDNAAGTLETRLKGKTLVLLGSAYEDLGMEAFEKPFLLTAEYTGMPYSSLLVPNAGVSGEIQNKPGVREKAMVLGAKIARE